MNTAQIVLIEDNPGDALQKRRGSAAGSVRARRGKRLCPGCHSSRPEHAQERRLSGAHQAEAKSALFTDADCHPDVVAGEQRSALQGIRYIQKPSQLEDFGQAVKELLMLPARREQGCRRPDRQNHGEYRPQSRASGLPGRFRVRFIGGL